MAWTTWMIMVPEGAISYATAWLGVWLALAGCLVGSLGGSLSATHVSRGCADFS